MEDYARQYQIEGETPDFVDFLNVLLQKYKLGNEVTEADVDHYRQWLAECGVKDRSRQTLLLKTLIQRVIAPQKKDASAYAAELYLEISCQKQPDQELQNAAEDYLTKNLSEWADTSFHTEKDSVEKEKLVLQIATKWL